MRSFEKYVSIWVAICIVIGIAVGKYLPIIPNTLSQWEYAHVSITVAVLIWTIFCPMMMKVDFRTVINVGKNSKGIIVTCITNWLIKPFLMFGLVWFSWCSQKSAKMHSC